MQTVKFTHFYDAPTDTKRVSFGGSSGIGKEARRTDLQGKSRGDGHLLVGMATTAILNLKPEGESPSSCLRRRDSPLSRLAQKTRSEQGKRPHQRVWSHSTNNRQTSFYQSCSRSLRRCRVRGMVDHPKPQSGKVAKMFISWK